MAYEFRAYCDICKEASPWMSGLPYNAKFWRRVHFATDHEDNPMKKENCRIQRRVKDGV